jgi:hypothetical protein
MLSLTLPDEGAGKNECIFIEELHHSPPVASFKVSLIDQYPRPHNDQFELFLSLGQGGTLEINEANHDFFLALAAELSNNELYSRICDHFNGAVTVRKALDRIRNPQFVTMPSGHLIDVLSSHFSEIDSVDLDDVPLQTLTEILSHDSL